MVSIFLEHIESKHEIFELVRVFYPNETINFIGDIKEYNHKILISISVNGDLVSTNVYSNGEIISNSTVNVKKININRELDKTVKIGIKQSLFSALLNITEDNLPWGILTGIRPIKIVHDLMEKSIDSNNILNILTNEYKLNNSKAKLIMDIANIQNKHIYPVDKDKYSLYISIPFCPTRCVYCSFPSLPIKRYEKNIYDYVNKLIYEIENIKEIMQGKKINTVYIGGGTPSSIPVIDLERIIQSVYYNFGTENIREFTVEAGRPDTISLDLLKMLKINNINRISINPQTMNDRTLKLIGRNHSSQDIINAYNIAKEIGIETINMDLIVGLPGEGIEEIENTLIKLEDLNPDNLTVHTLAVKSGSIFKEHMKEYEIDSQNIIAEMLNKTMEFAKKMNLEPYYLYRQKQILGNFENIGYAKPNKECIYNISIMEEKETIIAAGVGAVSKIYYPEENRIERIPNFKDLREYITRIDELIERKKHYKH